jgi:tetratricopeptide (TPR) repeat protein
MDCDISESDDEEPVSEHDSEIRDEEIYEPLDSVKTVADEVALPAKDESEIELQESDIVPKSEFQQQEPSVSTGKLPEQAQTAKKHYTTDFYALGQEAISRKDYGLAVSYFTNYIGLNPQDHQGYCELAQLNVKLRKYEIARENAEQAELLGSSIAGQLLEDIDREQSADQAITTESVADLPGADIMSAKAAVAETVIAPEATLDATEIDHKVTPETTDKSSDRQTSQIRVAVDPVDSGGSEPGQALHGSESDTTGSISVETAKVNDESSHRFFSLGMEAFERKDYGLAVSYFNEFVDLVPDEPRVYYNLALINYRLRNYDSAKEQAELAQKLGSDAAMKILRKINLMTTGDKQKDPSGIQESKTDAEAQQKAAVPEADMDEIRPATDPDAEESLKIADEEKIRPPIIDHGVPVSESSDEVLPPIEEKADASSPTPLMEDPPVTTRDCLECCEAAVNEKDYTSAIGHLERFVGLSPDDPRGYYNLAVLYYRLKDYHSAQEQAERAKELGSDAAEKILVKTADKLSKGLPKPEGEPPADKTQDHLDDTTYFEMESIEYPGEVIYLLDEQAVTVEKAQTTPDTDAVMQIEEGIDTNKVAPAVDTASGQEEKNTTFPDSEEAPENIIDFSDAAVDVQRPEARTDRLAPFLELPAEEGVSAVLEPETPEKVLSVEALEQDEQADAIESQTRSADEEADYFTLGTQAAESKNYELAIEHFSRFIESAPDEPHAYYNLAVLHYRLKDYNSAKEYARRAKELGSKAAKKVLKRVIDKLAPQQPVFEEDAEPNLPDSVIDSTTFFGVTDIDYGRDVELQETVDKQTTLPDVQTGTVDTQVDEEDGDHFGKESTDDAADTASIPTTESRIETPVVADAAEPMESETSDSNMGAVPEDIPTENDHSFEAGHAATKELSAEHNDTAIQADDGFGDSEENLFDTPENDLESQDGGLQYETAVKQDDFDPFASREAAKIDSETDLSDGKGVNDETPIVADSVSSASGEIPAGSLALKTEEEVPKGDQIEAPNDAKDYFTLGMEASNNKENEKAIDYFTKFIELKPDESRGHFNLSILYYRLKEFDAAEKHGKRAFQLGAKPAKVILKKIKKKRKQADQKEKTKAGSNTAEKKQVDAVAPPPAEDVPAKPEKNNRGKKTDINESTGGAENFETADTATVETTGMVEDGAVVWGADDLGGEVDPAVEAEKEKTAVQAFQNDIIVFDNQDTPKDGPPRNEGADENGPVKKFYDLGLAASEKKDYLAAIKHFTKVTQLLPDDPRGYYNLSLVSYRMKFYESAKEHANRAVALGSEPAKQIIEKIEARKAIA